MIKEELECSEYSHVTGEDKGDASHVFENSITALEEKLNHQKDQVADRMDAKYNFTGN